MGLLLSILAILDSTCRDQVPESVSRDPGLGQHPLVEVFTHTVHLLATLENYPEN